MDVLSLVVSCLAAVVAAAASATPGPKTNVTKVLFWDTTVMDAAGLTNGAELHLNKPTKLGRVISAEKDWELAEVGGYDKVLKVAAGDYRFYYLCNADYRMHPQRVCLARSADGLSWSKPNLGIVPWMNSTQNNIIWPVHSDEYTEPGTVFVDSNPACSAHQRFKMLLTWTPLKSRYGSAACGCAGCCEGGAYTLTSADGLAFAPLFGKDGALRPAYIGSDTQQTGHWDHVLGKYVVFVRGHQAGPAERTVLRCLTTDLRNWTSETRGKPVCPTVLAPDAQELALTDYYTSGATVYGDVSDGNVLFFPTPYRHFSGAQAECTCPAGAGNCGLVDIRFAFSRGRGAPSTVNWVASANGREAVIPLGRCTCCDNACGWCQTDVGLAATAFDTAEAYSVVGYLADPQDPTGSLLFYYSGQPFSHGQNTAASLNTSMPGSTAWGKNSGIGAVRYRMDGFVSVDAGTSMLSETNRSNLPGFVTAPIALPSTTTTTRRVVPAGGGGDEHDLVQVHVSVPCQKVEVFANVESSAAGSVFIEVVGHANRSLADAQPIQGNSLRRAAQWPGPPGAEPVCAKGSVSRSGPNHQGDYCTQCSYEIQGGQCAGLWPDPVRCNSTVGCRAEDSGTCHGQKNVCNATGFCVNPAGTSTWCQSKAQRASGSSSSSCSSVVEVGPGETALTLRVALVAAKLYAIELACAV
jgi:hypothetical protein